MQPPQSSPYVASLGVSSALMHVSRHMSGSAAVLQPARHSPVSRLQRGKSAVGSGLLRIAHIGALEPAALVLPAVPLPPVGGIATVPESGGCHTSLPLSRSSPPDPAACAAPPSGSHAAAASSSSPHATSAQSKKSPIQTRVI